MSAAIYNNPAVRHDALILIEVVDSNPNGDPDAGNQPRTDPETGQGLITDVSIKRKVRDTIAAMKETLSDPERYHIYVTAGIALNTVHESAHSALGEKSDDKSRQKWLAQHYFDIRMFGAVMSTGKHPAGRLTGPVQVGIARSVDAVVPTELAITRVTKTVEGKEDQSEMGSKWIIPYGLYAARIHYSPALGAKSGVTTEDLDLFWSVLPAMWDHTRSASRTNIATRGLYVFTHSNALGNAQAGALVEQIHVKKTKDGAPRSWSDYEVTTPPPDALPPGITLTTLA